MSQTEFLARLKEHQGLVYKLVNLYARTGEDRKDMYQEIVLQAWKAYPQFRGEARFSTWLYRLCLNTILTLVRHRGTVEYTDTSRYEDRPTTAPAEDIERLYTAIRQLPESERAVVSLSLDGYSNQEIGEMMGITANLVGVKLHRARQQLSNLLVRL